MPVQLCRLASASTSCWHIFLVYHDITLITQGKKKLQDNHTRKEEFPCVIRFPSITAGGSVQLGTFRKRTSTSDLIAATSIWGSAAYLRPRHVVDDSSVIFEQQDRCWPAVDLCHTAFAAWDWRKIAYAGIICQPKAHHDVVDVAGAVPVANGFISNSMASAPMGQFQPPAQFQTANPFAPLQRQRDPRFQR